MMYVLSRSEAQISDWSAIRQIADESLSSLKANHEHALVLIIHECDKQIKRAEEGAKFDAARRFEENLPIRLANNPNPECQKLYKEWYQLIIEANREDLQQGCPNLGAGPAKDGTLMFTSKNCNCAICSELKNQSLRNVETE